MPQQDLARLAVFVKHIIPGAVKTRLARTIGGERAARLQRVFLETIVERLGGLAEHRELVVTPDEAVSHFQCFEALGWSVVPQGAGDLGDRLRRYLECCFAQGRSRVVVLGADSPDVPAKYLEQAWRMLRSLPVVLGPAEDGGYYLLGVAQPVPEILTGIDWGTERVWLQTVERLSRAGLPYGCLPPWYDVDRVDDLPRLAAAVARAEEDVWQPLRRELAEVWGSRSGWTTV